MSSTSPSLVMAKLIHACLYATETSPGPVSATASMWPRPSLPKKWKQTARRLAILLRSAISPVQSASAETVEWEKARRVIARLGDSPRWPAKSEFPDWVVEQALPALRFAVLGTPLSGEGTGADISPVAVKAIGLSEDGEGEGSLSDEATLEALAEVVGAAAGTARRQHLTLVPPLIPELDHVASSEEGTETA